MTKETRETTHTTETTSTQATRRPVMEFGLYDHMDKNDLPLGDFYENRLRLAEAYDRLGFYGLHTAEHHSTPLGMSPSPSVFHSAVAQRTKRLRMGPLVYTLNLYHPLRLAEEICMLDHLSRGRLLLGVGRGISPFELGYFGADPEDGPAMYMEALQVIRQALTSDVLTHEGRFYRYKDVPIELHPLQRPHPPLWYGIGNPDSVPWCVANRVNVVANGPNKLILDITARYRAAWAEANLDAAELPRMGVTRHMVVAETDEEAYGLARQAYLRWQSSYFHLFKKHNARPRFNIFSENFDEVVANGLVIAGSASTVRDAVLQLQEQAGINYLLCRFAFGNLQYEDSLRSAELFAEEVMPAFAGRAAPAQASA
jgi:alkanesulfonate monooxygenase SsuD/methylene tetrahydromethanopterin reductase-like flavin-dependent oxidoreductase (luciferase family)